MNDGGHFAMQAGSDDMRRRIIVVVILGIVGLVGVGALLAGMYSVIDTAGEVRRRAEADARAGRGRAADAAAIDDEIAAAAESRFATLPEAARAAASDMRAVPDPRAFAGFVDSAVRHEMAERCVRAYFGGDGAGEPQDTSEVLPGALAAPELAAARTILGSMIARSPSGGRAGRSASAGGTAAATNTFRAWFERGFAEVQVRFAYQGRAVWKIESMDVTPCDPPAGEARPAAAFPVR